MPLISEDFKRVVSHPISQLARMLKIGPKHVNPTPVTLTSSVSTKSSIAPIPNREIVAHADGMGITEAASHEESSAWTGSPGRRQSHDAYIRPVRISATPSLPTPNKCNDSDMSTDSTLCDEKDSFWVVPMSTKATPPDGNETVDTIIYEDPCEPPAQVLTKVSVNRIMCQDMLAQVGWRVEAKTPNSKARNEPPPFKTPLRARPSIKRIMGRDMLAQEKIRDNLFLFGMLDRKSSLAEVIVATEALGALYSEHSEMVDVPSDEVVAMYLGNTRSSNSPKDKADRKEPLQAETLATKPKKQPHMPLRIVIPDRSTPLRSFHWPPPPPLPVSRPATDISTHSANPDLHLVAPFLFSPPPELPSSTPFASLRPFPSRRPKSAIISDISFMPTRTALHSSRRRSTPILNYDHTLYQNSFRRYRYTTECTPRNPVPWADTVHPLDTSSNTRPSAFTFGKNAVRKARSSITNRLERHGAQVRPVSGLIAFWEGQEI